jgi:16S rRNA (guanine(527)-N(7))-methyltransferase RsmG
MSGLLLDQGAALILGRPLDEDEREQFRKYLDLLVKWSRAQRLVGSTEPSWITGNLLLDSLLFVQLIPGSALRVADLGSGAGVPGVPIAIVRPDLRITLVEARAKRVSFLSAVLRELRRPNLALHGGRLEALPEGVRFEAIVMRCAGGTQELIPLAVSRLHPGGVLIASGPPTPRPAPAGEWVEVRGVGGRARRFLVVRAS